MARPRQADFDRRIPRDGWFDFCFDPCHTKQAVPACPACGAMADGERVTVSAEDGTITCGHCDARGHAVHAVMPPRRPGGRVVGEPPIVDGPPPEHRVVGSGDVDAVMGAFFDALPDSVRARRRVLRPTPEEAAIAKALVAQGGVEHAMWCARRLAVAAKAAAWLPPDSLTRIATTA